MWQGISLKSERNNPLFKPRLNILLHTNQLCVPQYIRSMFRVLGIYNFAADAKGPTLYRSPDCQNGPKSRMPYHQNPIIAMFTGFYCTFFHHIHTDFK
jgi:hypothetical protein